MKEIKNRIQRIEEFCDEHFASIMVGIVTVGCGIMIGSAIKQNKRIADSTIQTFNTATMIRLSQNNTKE